MLQHGWRRWAVSVLVRAKMRIVSVEKKAGIVHTRTHGVSKHTWRRRSLKVYCRNVHSEWKFCDSDWLANPSLMSTPNFIQMSSEVLLIHKLSTLPVQHRIDYKGSVLTYKTLNTSVPQYLSQRINRRVNARTLRSSATPLAHPTVRSYRLRETFFSMCRAVCLELTSRVCHRKRLIVCIQI